MTDEIVLTPEGRDKLVEELNYREGQKHDEIVEHIKIARGFGDLSENSEFDDAKDEEAKNASRINEIRTILATARVVENEDAMEVSLGSTVELKNGRGRKTTFTIVGTTETDSLAHKISNESPAGRAVIGHGVGDTISFKSPAGKVRIYTITKVTR
ncbi:transcription elongation factor GreA [Atopobium sp. oral taxon 416]|jgi:transcription elongation factor GreA|uniref:transcription elongation factor GreA n=1 Tax=Atopobium sp. oral taxon 416 TaxID=712157 RepID=UPI003530090B